MRKRPSLPEPAPQTETVTVGDSTGGTKVQTGGAALGGGGAADIVYQEAVRISNMRFPYVWGGGHGSAGSLGRGVDCSGYVVACLAKANLGFRIGGGTAVSGALMSWGEAGFGKKFTVMSNSGHTWILFHNYPHKRADTGHNCGEGSGARVRSCARSSAGFVPRHWAGL